MYQCYHGIHGYAVFMQTHIKAIHSDRTGYTLLCQNCFCKHGYNVSMQAYIRTIHYSTEHGILQYSCVIHGYNVSMHGGIYLCYMYIRMLRSMVYLDIPVLPWYTQSTKTTVYRHGISRGSQLASKLRIIDVLYRQHVALLDMSLKDSHHSPNLLVIELNGVGTPHIRTSQYSLK